MLQKMKRIKISNPLGTANVTLSVPGGQQTLMVIATDFDSLDQPNFVDAIERNYRLYEVEKDGQGGLKLYAYFAPAQRDRLVEDVADLFYEHYKETY